MDDSVSHNPFPVIPGTDEYEALSFLVRNRGDAFSPPEIAAQTNSNTESTSTTLTRLIDKELIKCSQGAYYVGRDRAAELQHRLESVDAAERLHDTAPDDDIYAMTDWEEKVNLDK